MGEDLAEGVQSFKEDTVPEEAPLLNEAVDKTGQLQSEVGGDPLGKDQSTATKLPPFQRDAVKKAVSESEQAFESGELSPDFFPGDTVAGFNQAEELSQQQRLGASGRLEGLQDSANQSSEFALNLPQNISDNETVQNAIDASLQPVTEQFQDEVLPELSSGAVEAGQVGSSRAGIAQGLAADRVTENLANTSSRLQGEFFNQALNAQSRARSQLPQLAQFNQTPGQISGQVGQERRALEQARINEEIARHRADETSRLRELSNFRNLITGEFGGRTEQEGGNNIGSLIGGIASGLGAFFSSEEVKENKRSAYSILPRVEKLRVEAWDYKEGFGDEGTHIGPYAEEFQELFGVGDGKTIHVIDAIGVLLLAVKELNEEVKRLREDG